MCITREFVGMNIFNNFSSKLLDLINVDITFMKSKEKQKSHINVLIKVTEPKHSLSTLMTII